MAQAVEDWYKQMPIITRSYLTAAIVTTIGCSLEIISPYNLYLNPRLVVKQYQIWRLITNFLYFRKMDLDFLFHMFFLARYCKLLEENSFRGKTADFFYMLLFGATVLTTIVLVGGMIPYVSESFAKIIFLSNSLTFMMVYVWSKQNPFIHMSFLGLFTFTAAYLPWVLLGFSVLVGASAWVDLLVQPLIKTLTFNIICSLLFGIERGPKRDKLLPHFQYMMEGLLAIPINLPFTQFHRGILARRNLVPMLIDLIREKREALEEQKQQANPHKDLITSLLSIRNDDGSTMMSDEEIIDNIIVVMVGGYDTTSILLTFLVRLLDNNESIYSTIVSEQEEILKSKAPGEALTWEDLTKMKYTWRVASEMMRVNPPAILSFRRAMQDIEYGGFMIPKGWQVLISQSMTHMNNDIFQDPTTFDPTRFEKHAPQPPPYSFVAFGAGPRMCPGIELAKMETLAMMHHLVTQFRWELVDRDESFKRKPMPIFDQGLLVRVTPIKGTFMSSF